MSKYVSEASSIDHLTLKLQSREHLKKGMNPVQMLRLKHIIHHLYLNMEFHPAVIDENIKE